jgi:hypothetical protein
MPPSNSGETKFAAAEPAPGALSIDRLAEETIPLGASRFDL